MEKTWTPNETQKLFMDILGNADGALTLAEVSQLAGKEIKSGAINTLIAKGLVISNPKSREIVCAHCGAKRKVGTYELAKASK